MSEQRKIYNIEFKGVDEQIDELGRLVREQGELKKEIKDTGKVDKETSDEKARQLVRTKEELRKNQRQQRELRKEIDLQAKATDRSGRSLNAMRGQLTKMKRDIADLEPGTDAFFEQARAINELNDEVKQAEFQMGNFTRNVGNYQEAADTANMSLNEMRKEIRQLRDMPVSGRSEKEVRQLNQRIGELNDAMVKLRQHQEMQGMDTMEAFSGSLRGVTSVAQTLAGTMNLIGVESEVFDRLQRNILSLMAVTQGLASIEQIWHRGNIQRTGQILASTAATAKNTAARVANRVAVQAQARAEAAKITITQGGTVAARGAAVAQLAWNRALMAFPLAGIIAVITAAIAGIVALTRAIRRNRDATFDLNEEMERKSDLMDEIDKKERRALRLARLRGETEEQIARREMQYNQQRIDNVKQSIDAIRAEIAAEIARLKARETSFAAGLAAMDMESERMNELKEAAAELYKTLYDLELTQIEMEQQQTERVREREQTEAEAAEEARKREWEREDQRRTHLERMAELERESREWFEEMRQRDLERERKVLEQVVNAHREARKTIVEIHKGMHDEETETEEIPLWLRRAEDDARYLQEVFEDSYEGRRQALDKMLQDGEIGEKRHHDYVMQLEQERRLQTIEGYQSVVNAARQGFGENAKAQRALSVFEQGIALSNTIQQLALGQARAAAAAPPPANIPLIATFLAQTAGIINTIRTLRTPEPPAFAPVQFEKGGRAWGFKIGGKPHTRGGTKFVGEDGTRFEEEKDEALVVVNKHDTPLLSQLSDINAVHGRRFAEGGLARHSTAGLGTSVTVQDVMDMIESTPVVLYESDVTAMSQRVRKIKVSGDLKR